MDPNKLQLFVALAETVHFNRAAERCFVSPSKLSRTIKALEEELQVKLFERDNRSVVLTEQGRLFLKYTRENLQQLETIKHRLQQQTTELTGAISLYCSVTASYSFLYDILTDFRRQHPRIELRLHTGDPAEAIERVIAGREDIAIAAKPEKPAAGVKIKSFATSPLQFISPTDSNQFDRKQNESTESYWQRLPLILSERGIARERLDRWFSRKRISPNIYAQVAGNEAIVSMVSLGFGVGLVPEIVVENSPLKERVRLLPEQIELAPYEVGICVLEKRLKSPLVEAFWERI
ncbi:HTH-type transcriptional activator IlvY [Teredinibacter turnerae]|uniref:HTH-type transcriptional activator IlvY n=1 Tax=Teredinibacter turnerae TaxID=2426 RepID=UPI0030D1C79E